MTSFYKLQGSNVVVDPTTNVTKLPRSEPMARCHEPWRASNATAREKTEPALDKPRRRLPIPEGMLRTVSDYGPCSRFSTMGPTSGQEQADKSPFVCSSFTRRDDTHCSIVSTPTSQDDDSCYSPMSLPQTRQEHTCCPPVATSAAREKPAAVARRIHTSLKPEEARPLDPSEIQAQRKEQHRLTEEIRRYKERKTYTRALNGPLSKLSDLRKSSRNTVDRADMLSELVDIAKQHSDVLEDVDTCIPWFQEFITHYETLNIPLPVVRALERIVRHKLSHPKIHGSHAYATPPGSSAASSAS